MCGISGLWNRRLAPEQLSNRIKQSIKLLNHRGPDDAGVWQDSNIGLSFGHRRLSIIDTSINAHQPMVHASGKHVLVFNGEIYNYRELYSKYINSGRNDIKIGDTAVLLELLVQMGADVLNLIDGMFSFAFIDHDKRELLLARDRFGEKPLYWTHHNEQFAFSSELSSLRVLVGNTVLNINQDSLAIYHMIGSIPAPKTIYSDIYALEPGYFMRVPMGGKPEIKRYWFITKGVENSADISQEGQERSCTQELLVKAVGSRLVSDVPVGIFLSGGIDSNAILATAFARGTPPQTALSIDFPEKKFSESVIAKTSAKQYGVHFEQYVLEQSTFERGIYNFFSVMDQPTVDGFNTYFLSQAAHETGTKVWLSGAGGDELFGGYPSFRRMMYLRKLISYLQMIVPSNLALLISGMRIPARYARILNSLSRGSAAIRAYQTNRVLIPPAQIRGILKFAVQLKTNELLALLDKCYPNVPDDFDDYQAASVLETSVYMRSQLLRDVDNFSMAHSIEVRLPFLDHHLFTHVWSLDEKYKMDNERIKPLLQESVPGGIPDIVPKSEKTGFTFPVEEWLKKGMEINYREVVLDSSNAEFWNLSELERKWNAYEQGALHWSVLWEFYSYSMWLRTRPC